MTDEINEAPTGWVVYLTRRAEKQALKLPEDVFDTLAVLRSELEEEGPVQPEWQNFGKLKGKQREYYHCHLNKGHPRYVAVWEVLGSSINVIEIIFAGPHGSVNYRHFK